MTPRLPGSGRVLISVGVFAFLAVTSAALLQPEGDVPGGWGIAAAALLLTIVGVDRSKAERATRPLLSAGQRDVDGGRQTGLRFVGTGVLGLGWFAVVCAVIYAREGTLERLSIGGGLIQLVVFALLLWGAVGLASHTAGRFRRWRRVTRLREDRDGVAGGVVVHRTSSGWFATDPGVPGPLRERLGPFAVDAPDVLAPVAAVVGALLVPATYLGGLADEPDRWAQIVLAGAAPVLVVVAGAVVVLVGRRAVARRLAVRDRAADEVRAGYPGHWADLARRPAPSTTGSLVPGEPGAGAGGVGSEVLRARAQDLVRAVDHPTGPGHNGAAPAAPVATVRSSRMSMTRRNGLLLLLIGIGLLALGMIVFASEWSSSLLGAGFLGSLSIIVIIAGLLRILWPMKKP